MASNNKCEAESNILYKKGENVQDCDLKKWPHRVRE